MNDCNLHSPELAYDLHWMLRRKQDFEKNTYLERLTEEHLKDGYASPIECSLLIAFSSLMDEINE